MSELEVLEESYSLCHTNVTINLEAHVSYRISWINVSYDIFRDDIQPWCLQCLKISKKKK